MARALQLLYLSSSTFCTRFARTESNATVKRFIFVASRKVRSTCRFSSVLIRPSVACFKRVDSSPVKRSDRLVQTEDVKLQLQLRDRVLNVVKEAGLRQNYVQADLELLCVGTFK